MVNEIATEEQGIELLYRGRNISRIPFENVSQHNNSCFELDIEPLLSSPSWSKQFNIPQAYKDIDVEDYILRLVTDAEDPKGRARVEMELAMFASRNLLPILQLLIFLVDEMRKNNIVWGVGRGSSVASYVLYLIGVHKIDSLRYDLKIEEFLK